MVSKAASDQGIWTFFCTQHWWDHAWNSVSSSGLLSTGEIWSYQRESIKWPQVRSKDWRISLMRKVWKTWKCLPWRKKSLKGTHQCVWMSERNVQRKEARLFPLVFRDRTRGNGKNETGRQRNTCLLWGWLNAVTDCPERSRNIHSWRYSKAIWTWSWAVCSWWPCLSRGVLPDDPHRSLSGPMTVLGIENGKV